MSYSYTSFDEKSDYEQRRHRRNSTRSRASSASTFNSSSSFMSEKSDDSPPPYSNVCPNSVSDKPLPPLPLQQRRVRFAVEKPLPALPEDRKRVRADSSSSGEYAWWAQGKRTIDEEEEEGLIEKSSS